MATTRATGRTPVPVRGGENLATVLWERSSRSPSKEILRSWQAGTWQSMSWGELATRVRDIAAGLIAIGIEPGDRVALMSSTRLEWTVSDLAIVVAGAVSVPIYETSSVDQCAWVLSDSGCKAAIVGTADHAKQLDGARDEAPELGEIFVMDDGGLDSLVERAGSEHAGQVDARARATKGEDLFSLIYTSGTTGNPKGCELTHHNMLWTARQSAHTLHTLLRSEDASTLLFLPLAHSFARLMQYMCLEADVPFGYARSVETLAEDIRSFKPTFLLSVPRVFEKVFNTAQRKAEGPKRRIFDFAVSAGTAWSTAVDAGRSPGMLLNLQHAIAAKLVYAKLNQALGGRMEFCVSGGAPLAPHLAHFFHAAGIDIYEGYGLTETSAPATVNTPDKQRIGTVGPPLPGVEIAIEDDGEILIKGGNIFRGYWRNAAATAEVLDDGWFRSGDVGEIDADGFLKITGRKKELIVTAGGKNVAPAVLEERLKAHRLVSQCMVVGDNRPFIGALVTLEPEELAAFAQERQLAGSTAGELRDDPQVSAEIDKAVAHANEAVSQAESIRKIVILPRDFTLEDGEMTPSLKVRRAVCAEHFSDEIERVYAR